MASTIFSFNSYILKGTAKKRTSASSSLLNAVVRISRKAAHGTNTGRKFDGLLKSITQEMKDYRTRIMQIHVCPSIQFGEKGPKNAWSALWVFGRLVK
jgi:hypothetical protein